MDQKTIKFYTIPHHLCSCTDDYDNLTNIGKYYKKFFEEVNFQFSSFLLGKPLELKNSKLFFLIKLIILFF